MQKKTILKKIWLLVYGAANPSITHTMLREDTATEVVECHTTTDRANKYTLIVLQKRLRILGIQRIMAKLQVKHGIIKTSLMGVESINSHHRFDQDLAIESNVAFRWIAKDRSIQNPLYEGWQLDSSKPCIIDEIERRRLVQESGVRSMNNKRAAKTFVEMQAKIDSVESELQESKRNCASLNTNIDLLLFANKELIDRCSRLEQQLLEANAKASQLKE